MSEINIELACKYLEDVWNTKKRDQIDVLLSDDFFTAFVFKRVYLKVKILILRGYTSVSDFHNIS